MLKSAYDIRQTPDRSWEKTHNMIEMSRRNYEYAISNRRVFRLLLKCQWTGHTWWCWGACYREKGRHAQNNACQDLPGDNEVSSRDVYPQIVETSQVCRATVVMTCKVEPCQVEPCRPATRSCNVFCTQLAASVDFFSTGVIWSYFRRKETMRAALFWQRCSWAN